MTMNNEKTKMCERSCAACDEHDCQPVRRILQNVLGDAYNEDRAAAVMMVADNYSLHHEVPRADEAAFPFLEAVTRLISQRMHRLKDQNVILEERSVTDELTQLLNRRGFMDRFHQEMACAERGSEQLGLLMIDIDRFKVVNDTYGHAFGDTVLRGVAAAIKNAVREYDIVGRLGGEEMAVVVRGLHLDQEGVSGIAEKIRKEVAALRFSIPNSSEQYAVTISIGADLFFREYDVKRSSTPSNQIEADIAALMGSADLALYAAKNGGRNQVVFAEQKTNVVSIEEHRQRSGQPA